MGRRPLALAHATIETKANLDLDTATSATSSRVVSSNPHNGQTLAVATVAQAASKSKLPCIALPTFWLMAVTSSDYFGPCVQVFENV